MRTSKIKKRKNIFMEDKYLPTWESEFENLEEAEFDSTIWTTELVDDLKYKVEFSGLDLNKCKHPFFNSDPNIRKSGTSFQLSDFELEEFKKCKNDVLYFAKYVKLMQEDGIDFVNLYDYQEDMLRMYTGNRLSLCLGSRQIGKCLFLTQLIDTEQFGIIPLYKLWFKIKTKRTVIDYLKYSLYYLYSKLN